MRFYQNGNAVDTVCTNDTTFFYQNNCQDDFKMKSRRISIISDTYFRNGSPDFPLLTALQWRSVSRQWFSFEDVKS